MLKVVWVVFGQNKKDLLFNFFVGVFEFLYWPLVSGDIWGYGGWGPLLCVWPWVFETAIPALHFILSISLLQLYYMLYYRISFFPSFNLKPWFMLSPTSIQCKATALTLSYWDLIVDSHYSEACSSTLYTNPELLLIH